MIPLDQIAAVLERLLAVRGAIPHSVEVAT
jgi:hypothetical protein